MDVEYLKRRSTCDADLNVVLTSFYHRRRLPHRSVVKIRTLARPLIDPIRLQVQTVVVVVKTSLVRFIFKETSEKGRRAEGEGGRNGERRNEEGSDERDAQTDRR